LSLTGHWINQDFQRKHGVLNASSFVGQHTAEAIKNEINRMLAEWQLKDKALSISSDNAANAIAGIALTHIDHQRCFAHTLQLVINDAISSSADASLVTSIARL
jgi:hypothetical protein